MPKPTPHRTGRIAGRTSSGAKRKATPPVEAARPVGRPAASQDAVARRVLETASAQYMRLGFSSVTTDETARAAGISKKTLYQLFPSKDALLRSVVRENCERHSVSVRTICRDEGVPVGVRLKRMLGYISKLFGEMGPAIIHDLQRSAPRLWKEVEECRAQCVREDIGTLLREGRERGDFRKDIDPEIFMIIYTETLRSVVNPQVFARMGVPPARIYENVYKVLFEGILTEKARKEST
ncbi:MAG TPA: TetR/AcrR family transcriptional regulator [Fibrobacteria bacterium]|nr:TetR/AcrR family transcriptional regulator [Fibrobacteria bacterium]